MIVVFDIGNTRIKWGVHEGADWLAQGVLPTAEACALGEVAASWPRRAPLVGCNVAGAVVEAAVIRALGDKAAGLRWLRSSAQACGVRNAYEPPEKLGADRWAALIGARARLAGDCLVVCAGTATTVDWLDADGLFRGGLILPGSDLMRRALAKNTAQLPLLAGHYRETPRNTVDAITSGCLFAQLGAIERMFTPLAGKPGALCLLTGGAAHGLASQLRVAHRVVDNLVLEGLLQFASSPCAVQAQEISGNALSAPGSTSCTGTR